MDIRLWLAIAFVSAVTAVILARRKNRSTVIWPVASFVFPPALLPLFALAPLPEKNTERLDRWFLLATSSIAVLLVAIALLRYGSLHPCNIYVYETWNSLGVEHPKVKELGDFYGIMLSPSECLSRLFSEQVW